MTLVQHNHPASVRPSYADIRRLAVDRFVKASLVACHDGKVYCISEVKPEITEAFDAAYERIKRENPNISSRDELEILATDELYRENRTKKWFRLTTKS